MTLTKILIAGDFSKHSDYALQRAIYLAEEHKAQLIFLHVLTQPWIGALAQHSIQELDEEFIAVKKKTEEELFNRLKKYSQQFKIQISVQFGRATDEIVRYAHDNHCDIIVAGAHGEYYINDYVLGTTSGAIVRNSLMPVLLVKKDPTFSYNRILIATDLSEVSRDAIEFTYKSFPNATFQLLHVVDVYYRKFFNVREPDEYLIGSEIHAAQGIVSRLDEFLTSCQVDKSKFQQKIMGGYYADLIVSQSEKWQADLVAFGTQGNSKLHYLLMGSVTKRLLQLSTTDMLAVPPRNKKH
ncbi:MAG TPA: universal stress protein [Legionella sp.]|nr:universal stress protein [Legionella sp.]